jgi:sugar lactone lactonase YvrE
MKKYVLSIAVAFAITTTLTAQHQLVQKWETDTLLKVPESVLYDAAGKVLYVANIDGQPWEKDGKGSIGKVGLDGKIIAVDWVSGLNCPKGMGLYKNKLYVADFDHVAVIDIKSAAIVELIPVEGAQGLNDVSIDKNGVIYVTDSRTKKVHRIENGQVAVYVENLKGPNGVLADGDEVFVLDAGGLYKVAADKSLTKIADGMEGGTDGVERIAGKDKEYIVSCWGGCIYYVKADGTKEQLLDSRSQKINSADIGYDAKNRIVYVPTFWKNKVVAYEVK